MNLQVVVTKQENRKIRNEAQSVKRSISDYLRSAIGLPVLPHGGKRPGAGRPKSLPTSTFDK